MSYRWEINEPPESQVNELRDAGEVSRVAALALSRLGITASRVAAYLRPMLSQLSDPYQLPGVEKAAERLWEAIRRQERILVYGDYDTDGITATVLVAEVLSANGAHVDCYLPHRIDDGYGLTAEAVERVCTAEQTVLLTVDCGITCAAAVEAANARGMDVIITDHHEPHEAIPEALAVIDPKLPDAPPVVQSLAGVGVAFKLCHGFIKYGRRHDLGGQDTDLRQFLDLVALGTVADIVPLLDENRCLVTAGLDVLSQQIRPGIRALCEVTNLRERVRTTDITFRIAPRINAAGRLGNPDEAFQLLHARDTTEAYQLAAALDGRNRERQQVEAQVLAAAEEQIAEIADIEQCHTVVVCGEEWHKGVIGIVASRLVRKYNRPSIVLTRDSDGALCGSGRSLHNLNLVTLLGVCEVHLQRFGGHAMAAGLALDP
ncbi:MAG: single-stranded-DNA-specific exonuclease RecJ, partial [Verrucomicrobiota bacterium]